MGSTNPYFADRIHRSISEFTVPSLLDFFIILKKYPEYKSSADVGSDVCFLDFEQD